MLPSIGLLTLFSRTWTALDTFNFRYNECSLDFTIVNFLYQLFCKNINYTMCKKKHRLAVLETVYSISNDITSCFHQRIDSEITAKMIYVDNNHSVVLISIVFSRVTGHSDGLHQKVYIKYQTYLV